MKKKIKNKAFTLIELLAVIAVLAIILIIAMPKILGVIDKSNKESFNISGYQLIKTAKDRLEINSMVPQEDKIFEIKDGEFVGDYLPISGKLPNSGTVLIKNDGRVAIAVQSNNLCFIKHLEESKPNLYEDTIDCVLYIPEPVPDSCFSISSTSTETTITNYDITCSKNPIIPNELGGLPVKIIGISAFATKQLTSVFIPNTVTTISEMAFMHNQIRSVEIPNSVISIGGGAFNDNKLIEDLSFVFARNPDGTENKTIVMSYGGAKRDNVIIPDTVVTIGVRAFESNLLTSVTIPNSVRTLLNNSFNYNRLTSIIIPESVTSMGTRSFSGNQLTSVVIPNGITSLGPIVFNGNQLTSVVFPSGLRSIATYTFGNNRLTNIDLPNTLTGIAGQAFANNQLTSLVLPNSLTSIGEHAFAWNKITNLVLSTNLTTIVRGAFNGNQLPDDQAFIYARRADKSIDYTTLVSYGGARKDNIIIPSTIETIGTYAMGYSGITNIVIPDTVKSIGDNSYIYNSLTNITMPESVTITTSSVSASFYNTYVVTNLSSAGIYTSTSQGGIWTKQ